jgi:hypothetical protein
MNYTALFHGRFGWAHGLDVVFLDHSLATP